jgi:hypothetical protein
MLNRTARLAAAIAFAMLALPATAGSWPATPGKAPAKGASLKVAQVHAATDQAINGFIAEPGENVASLAPVRYFANDGKGTGYTPAAAQGTTGSGTARAGFEFLGGETGWVPAGHKFVWVGGSFAHSEECDHAIRVVAGPTRDEIERASRLSPGA